MKKIFAYFLCLLCITTLTACDGIFKEEHTHTYEYVCNEDTHQKVYTCGCPSTDIGENHLDSDVDSKCDVCGYPILTFFGKWYYSDTHHWQTPEGDAVFTPVYGYGTHIDEDANGICDVCNYQGTINKEQLTLDKVIELSAKGEKLTWREFEQYKSFETGSGLYILVFDIDETFQLIVGGSGAQEESPYYIRLTLKGNIKNYIDIRTDDVNGFIEANRK